MGLVSALIDEFQDRFPGVSDTKGLKLYKDIMREISDRCQLRNATVSISLTDGTRQYDWTATNFRVWYAMYFTSATDEGTIVEPVSTDELDIYVPGWRGDLAEDVPAFHYFTSATDGTGAKVQVGFHKIPPTTTSGGYPVVRFFCSTYADQAAGDTVPPALLSEQVVIDGMCWLWTKERHRDQADWWHKVFQGELHKNIAHIKNVQGTGKTRIHRTWMQGRSTV